jgi:hypothetical protein
MLLVCAFFSRPWRLFAAQQSAKQVMVVRPNRHCRRSRQPVLFKGPVVGRPVVGALTFTPPPASYQVGEARVLASM